MIGTTYWAWFGSIYLFILTIKDYKNNMMVDDRHNWFMMGITISLYSHFDYGFWWIVFLLALTFALRYFLGKFKVLGIADLNSIMWMFLGFSILNIYYTLWFSIIFLILVVSYWSLKKYIFKITKPTPFYMPLLVSFFLSCFIFSLYT